MHNLFRLDEKNLIDLINDFLPNTENIIVSSENLGDKKNNYIIYEDLSEIIIKEAIRTNRIIIENETYTCYFSYNRNLYRLKITYGIGNYNFYYEKVKKN